jgi:hypothetical protein
MARISRRVLGSIANQIANYVTWLLDRGFGQGETRQRVRQRFGANSSRVVQPEIDYYARQTQAAARYRRSAAATPIRILRVPHRGADFSFYRYHVKFTFRNPRTGQTETRGYKVDLESEKTKGQTQREIRSKIIEDILRDYHARIARGESFSQRVGPITVTRIEGI